MSSAKNEKVKERSIDLSLIIVSYDVKEYVLNCLSSIYKNAVDLEIEVLLVDNASKDETLEAVVKDFPQVKAIDAGGNLGFARANNLALKEARGRHVLFLNPDTVLHPGCLQGMVAFLDKNEEAGAAGCKVFYGDGRLQYTCKDFPSFPREVYSFYGLKKFLPMNGFTKFLLGGKLERSRSYDEPRKVDWLLGAFLMVRRSFLEEVGFFDENFFLYYEEIDLCLRLKEAGYSTHFIPFFTLTHFTGKSSENASVLSYVERHRSLLHFFRKHHPYQLPFLRFSLLPGLLFFMLLNLPFLWKKAARNRLIAYGKTLPLFLGISA
ncbi:MAG TPA: glycosyl transferase family 2 [Cyanobacteria bacterium UBA8530]|nr:glycosyl transferase family 2 [Cyanobacteria bacterium UBA8530]